MKTKFEPALHAFRGFAILCVVAIHAFGFMIYYAAHEAPIINVNFVKHTNEVLFHDSTIFFALISGILFSLILAQRGWLAFYQNKLLNVFLPYLFFSCLFTWFNWGAEGQFIVYNDGFYAFIGEVYTNLLSGNAIFVFWYIPVLLILYLSTPIIMKIIQTPSSKWLLASLILLPLFASRSWPDITWQNYAYFIGVYTVGLLVGTHYTYVTQKIFQHIKALGIIAIVTTLLLGGLFYYEVEKWQFISLRESIFYIQKITIAALAFALFKHYKTHTYKTLSLLGDYAFPIFFIHGYLLFGVYTLMVKIGIKIHNNTLLMLTCLLVLGGVLLLCVLISKLCQYILGRYSRHIIGA